ncbi:Disease resistance protein (TIR-NBS-LRR class) family [Melia azedarach]|uniref:Disease resistance protein (TIR-NBS-LRR class) family n=1 Tax=Melia azedarach TaxID=155640 RepID=A0ACC1XHM0_MELAZ|nr:Disease resistance protein (TIR-NBS-LRR class) family [Melia azedarach]
MAASSSSSSYHRMISQKKYDVFLSFRGEDTRQNFTDHLYAALCRQQIHTFIDDQLIKGDEISQSLLNVIEASSVSIIIFSETYASFGWCLDEFVKILECKNKYGQIVIPIFYHVDPSNIRNQTGTFGNLFSKLEEHFKERLEKLQRWRTALREVAMLSGFDSHVIRSENVLIEKIVEDILKRLSDMFSSNLNKDLVGVESRIKEIELSLSYGSMDVYSLGIWGIGGIGKTTIASAIFNKFSSHFDSSCFIENIREEPEKSSGLAHMWRELFTTLLEDRNLNIGIPNFSLNFVSKRLSRKKILIVFDDVTHFKQIESLIGSLDWFMPGSLIIITTRDKQVLKNCRVQIIYEMKGLVDIDALKIFNRYAFTKGYPDVNYNKLSNKLIQYTQGVPLALKVLGCFLHGKSQEDWESAMEKLKIMPHNEIQKVLKISYDGLDDQEQSIFLDIACFFKGTDKNLVVKFLEASGFFAKIGISVLIDKCLIMESNSTIIMHDLLQEMGKEIVRQESVADPGKRSRLWHHKDIYEVLTYNTGTKAIEGISLDMSEIEEIILNSDTFKKMHRLRILRFMGDINKCKLSHFCGPGFSEVRYLHWHGYPLKSLPSNIRPENLVSLELPCSEVQQLWTGVQNLVKLKQIDLNNSKQLTILPDLSKAQNLEKLILERCSSLVEIHSSIQHLNKLTIINLNQCKSLKSLSTSILSESLQKLYLSDCSSLKKFPEISLSCNIEVLFLDGTAIKELPSSIDRLSRLVTLNIRNCTRLEQLPRSICKLKSLEYFNLSGCSNLQRLPEELGNLDALRILEAERIGIKELPSSYVSLKNLDEVFFERFRGHEHMGFLMPISLSLDGLRNLRSAHLTDCGITELPENLGQLSSLEHLYLQKNNFERIPESIINLSKLQVIVLSYCERLQSLPKFPSSVYNMNANHCTSLKSLSDLSILFSLRSTFNSSQSFWLTNCINLDQNELRKITEDSLHKIRLLVTTSRKQLDQTYAYGFGDRICYPGNEIPKWFKFQSMGSSITMKLLPGWFTDKLLGFGLCAVVSFPDNHESQQEFGVWCDFKFKTELDGDWHVVTDLYVGHMYYVESDHVVLGYHFRMDCEDEGCIYRNERVEDHQVQFFLVDIKSGERLDVVRKCGIHLLYAQDVDVSMSKSFRTDEDEDESNLHPKRLRSS